MALLETEVRILSRPIDLSADVSELVGSGEWFFVQNTGHTEIRFRETAASPALGDKGHVLGAGDGVVLLVSRSFWIWPPTGSGEITISDGAPMPTRGA